jgi:deazaflavin-dependent oxidoreductase (nitroreductase family)
MSARGLPYVDPRTPRGVVYRAYARLVGTRLMGWLSRKIAWKVDPYLMRLTRGRVGMGLLLPTALLETRGARTGRLRRNGVIYFHDGERVTIIASKLGLPEHPAWFHNLRANPDIAPLRSLSKYRRFGGVRDDDAVWNRADAEAALSQRHVLLVQDRGRVSAVVCATSRTRSRRARDLTARVVPEASVPPGVELVAGHGPVDAGRRVGHRSARDSRRTPRSVMMTARISGVSGTPSGTSATLLEAALA